LFYQPLFDLACNRVQGFEALIRWHPPQRGLMAPGDFIALAEEIGLIVPLGRWILRQACADAVRWPNDISIAVNISACQFKVNGLVEAVLDALATSGLAPERLELEITETVLLEKTEANFNILEQLKKIGVRISLDDFGTGYSSLSYLRAFQFDKIKVDQSFVRGLIGGTETSAIVRAIADIGASFGIRTSAEGVETEEQLRVLRQEGYMEVQGFLVGEPSPISKVSLHMPEKAKLKHVAVPAGDSRETRRGANG